MSPPHKCVFEVRIWWREKEKEKEGERNKGEGEGVKHFLMLRWFLLLLPPPEREGGVSPQPTEEKGGIINLPLRSNTGRQKESDGENKVK